jgi:demethylmenaquinone methyltransferase/2-methoxy-6-polyprenyl-1,4-benzoquinol methylase
METRRESALALDFTDREGARKYEFSKVWNDKLHAVFSDVAPYYDVASDVASLGLCSRWRAKFLSIIQVKPGDKVLDVCAGTNAVGIGLMKKQPDIDAHAIDQSSAMQEVGKGLAQAFGFEIGSTIGDAHHLPFPDDYFDVVTLQYASRHLRVVDVFTEIKRVLKPGGRFYHCDMLRPESKIVKALYSVYLKTCVSATALIFRSGPEAWSCRDYFVRAIQTFYSAREITELLSHLGFNGISCRAAPGGVVASHEAIKP